jgi:hypothetical protein
MANISPAAIRLYDRLSEIEMEVEDVIADRVTNEELVARSERILARSKHLLDGKDPNPDDDQDFDFEIEERKTKAAMLAAHREYQWTKAELGRVLGLGPDDIHPLDIDFDKEWKTDDPGIEAWERALHLQMELTRAHMDWFCWWRRPATLRVVSNAEPEPSLPTN